MPRIFGSSSYFNTTGANYHVGSNAGFRLPSACNNGTMKSNSMRTLKRDDDDLELSDRGGSSLQLPPGTAYDVSVTSGNKEEDPGAHTLDQGIRTTTVITQKVQED